ncbi:putative uncharacterized protein [Bacteroides sp. CAG:702]|nr:putative uncharacterized protein [Bacteroides sp. CAG:702]
MSVVCTKCGSLDVACEAMVNPNTKRIANYTDESFDYAWCNSCRNGVVITDVNSNKHRISRAYRKYKSENAALPSIAVCNVVVRSSDSLHRGVEIGLNKQLFSNDSSLFSMVNGINELLTYCKFNQYHDFIITDFLYFK